MGSWGIAGCQLSSEQEPAAAGDGGAIVTQDENLARQLDLQRSLGQAAQNEHVVVGLNSKLDALQARIIDMARSGEPVVLYDLRPVLDYCFVDDVAAALVRACLAPVAGKTSNVGTMQGTSIRELASSVLRLLGKSSQVIEDSGHRRPGASEILRLVADNTRAVNELGWSPKKSLEEGLRLTLNIVKVCAAHGNLGLL